jgi:integrase
MPSEKSFPIYQKRHASGRVGFRLDLGVVNGKRSFKPFKTEEEAKALQRKLRTNAAKTNPVLLSDTDSVVRYEILGAVKRLKEFNATITEAVDFFLKHARPTRAGATIGEVMTEFKTVKTKAGLSSKYLKTAWDSFFVPFRDRFKDCVITDVTTEAAEKYVFGHKKWNATSRATLIRHLKVLFNFAIKRGYVTLNPFATIQSPKKAANNSREKVMTVESVIKLLNYANDNGYKPECAALVLILFCGVRVDEVERVSWEQVKLDENPPVIVLDETKANRRRVNAIPSNAVAWLKDLKKETGKIVLENYEGRMRYLRKKSGVASKQNAARISFASYHVALHEDPAKTSLLLGHQSPALLWNTYRAMVTKAEAKRYWKIAPGYTGEGPKGKEPTPEDLAEAKARALGEAVGQD